MVAHGQSRRMGRPDEPRHDGKPGPDAAAYPGADGRTGHRTRIAGLLGHGSQQAPGEIPRRPDRRSGIVGTHLPPPRDPAPRRPALRPDGRPLLLRPAGTLRRLGELPRRRPLPRGRRYDRDARDPHSVADPGLHAAAFPRIEMDAPGMERQSEEGTARRARPGIDRGHRPLRGERFDVAKHRGVLRHPVDLGHRKPFRRQDRYGRPASGDSRGTPRGPFRIQESPLRRGYPARRYRRQSDRL